MGGKWKPAILYVLSESGRIRFGRLRKSIDGITQKMLTQQLRELENDGIVSRDIFAEVPPRVEYALTEYGQSLRPLLNALADWGRLHLTRIQSQ